MKKRSLTIFRLSLCVLLALLSTSTFAQNSPAVRQYIERYRDIAIDEEIRTGVPAAITLAQGIHESSAGKSDLVTRSNNHFGIKCKTEWTGPRVYHDDDARGECFRSYEAPEQSYRDHSDFLKNRAPYRALFQLDPTDFEGWAHGLKKAGYATNPKYPQILIKIIRDYNLQDYTLIALGRKPRPQADVASVSSGNADAQFASSVSGEATVSPAPAPRYPAGIFRINETPVIHVPKGTSFLALAQQQNVALNFLFEFNDLKPAEETDRDMLIFLQRKKRSGASDLHVALEGETLWEVAQKEGVRMDALLDYNGLGYNRAFVAGELIALSGKASKPDFAPAQNDAPAAPEESGATATVATDIYILHKVQPKETLYSLAKKYGVRVEDIQQWNNLPSAGLKVGQQVRIKKS